MRITRYVLFLAFFLAAVSGSLAQTHVSSLADLKTALASASSELIIVDNSITLTDGTSLDGHGKTVSVLSPYLSAEGTINKTYSNYRVFTVESKANVTIKNITILGGYEIGDITYEKGAGGILVGAEAILNAENVTITRAFRAVFLSAKSKGLFKNCNIVRNACDWGAGIEVYNSATALLDGCSLSENRAYTSGGGAIEVKDRSVLYANNTIFANNSSVEIGGAVNNYGSTVYLMNSTMTGNLTVNQTSRYGGGIGSNVGYFYIVNSVLVDNFSVSSSKTMTRSDIAFFSGTPNNSIYNSVCSTVVNNSGNIADVNNVWVTSENNNEVFANYDSYGIAYSRTNVTDNFEHSVLVSKSDNPYELYAPLGELCLTGGTDTYFEYDNTLSTIKMGFWDGEKIAPLGNLTAPDESKKVTVNYDGSPKLGGAIGGSFVKPLNDSFSSSECLYLTSPDVSFDTDSDPDDASVRIVLKNELTAGSRLSLDDFISCQVYFNGEKTILDADITVEEGSAKGAFLLKGTIYTLGLDLQINLESVVIDNFLTYTASQPLSGLDPDKFSAKLVSSQFDPQTNVGTLAFKGKLTRIDNEAFDPSSSITSITIPDGVTVIGSSVFDGCSALKVVYTDNHNPDLFVNSIGKDVTYVVPCSLFDSYMAAGLTAKRDAMVKIDAAEVTCHTDGIIEHFTCPCGKHYSDQLGVHEIAEGSWIIPSGHIFTSYIYNEDATTEADGTETASCQRECGATDTRTAEGTKLIATPVDHNHPNNTDKTPSIIKFVKDGKLLIRQDRTIYDLSGHKL